MTSRPRLPSLALASILALALPASPALAQASDHHAHEHQPVSDPSPAGPDTLLSGEVTSGGFGAPVVKLTTIDGEVGVMGGVRGAWLIAHKLAIGLGGYWMLTEPSGSGGEAALGDVHLMYGGLEVEYTLGWTSLVHGTLIGMVGPGVVHRGDMHDDQGNDSERFFAAEAAARAEMNLTRWARLGIGAGYRFVTGSDDPTYGNAALSGPVAMLDLKLGAF